jgi:hypothetical protein
LYRLSTSSTIPFAPSSEPLPSVLFPYLPCRAPSPLSRVSSSILFSCPLRIIRTSTHSRPRSPSSPILSFKNPCLPPLLASPPIAPPTALRLFHISDDPLLALNLSSNGNNPSSTSLPVLALFPPSLLLLRPNDLSRSPHLVPLPPLLLPVVPLILLSNLETRMTLRSNCSPIPPNGDDGIGPFLAMTIPFHQRLLLRRTLLLNQSSIERPLPLLHASLLPDERPLTPASIRTTLSKWLLSLAPSLTNLPPLLPRTLTTLLIDPPLRETHLSTSRRMVPPALATKRLFPRSTNLPGLRLLLHPSSNPDLLLGSITNSLGCLLLVRPPERLPSELLRSNIFLLQFGLLPFDARPNPHLPLHLPPFPTLLLSPPRSSLLGLSSLPLLHRKRPNLL